METVRYRHESSHLKKKAALFLKGLKETNMDEVGAVSERVTQPILPSLSCPARGVGTFTEEG